MFHAIKRKGVVVLMVVTFSACIGQPTHWVEAKEQNSVPGITQAQVRESKFPYPEIPAMLTQPEERKAYMLQHYWDMFDFADTALVNNRNVAEQGLVDHLSLLTDGTVSNALVKESVEAFCRKMEQQEHAREVFLQQVENYLYNPNSPYRNERLYAVYLDCMLQSKVLDEARKSSLSFRKKLIGRNNPGSRATPFSYVLPDGRKSSLMQTPVNGNRLLLVFYDPECPSCHAVMEQMTGDERLAKAVEEKKLTVLAVYTEGDDTVWERALPEMPEEWIAGNDRMEVKDGALYDLRAMPSLYLLDGNRQVILKDAPYEEIIYKVTR